MKRILSLSLIGSAVVLCLAATAARRPFQAQDQQPHAGAHASIVSKTGWHRHHRHCWWSHHHRHCR